MGEPGDDKRVEKGSGFSDFHLHRAKTALDLASEKVLAKQHSSYIK